MRLPLESDKFRVKAMGIETIVYFILVLSLPKVDCSQTTFEISSNQPVVMGSNITFTVTLRNPEQDSYDIQWSELPFRTARRQVGILNKSNSFQSNWTLHYAAVQNKKGDYLNPGTYAVTASVSYLYLGFITVSLGSKVSYFNLTDHFDGTLEATQPGVKHIMKDSYISTANETQFIVKLHDPTNFLEEAINVTWSWYNTTSFIKNTTDPILKQNITQEGEHTFNVTLTAFYNNTDDDGDNGNTTAFFIKSGVYKKQLTARVPVSNFTVVGETWFRHGKILNLKIFCNGSQPYSYCMHLYPSSHNITGNETCEDPEITNECEIPFVWYFNEPGPHALVIVIENDVAKIVNRTLIVAYKVPKKQPLSIVIVPISCSLFALVMIIFGIAYFWGNRARFSVEVADFDFGQDEDLPYMTFRERLKDALTSTSSSRQRSYNSQDDEGSLIPPRRPSTVS